MNIDFKFLFGGLGLALLFHIIGILIDSFFTHLYEIDDKKLDNKK